MSNLLTEYFWKHLYFNLSFQEEGLNKSLIALISITLEATSDEIQNQKNIICLI